MTRTLRILIVEDEMIVAHDLQLRLRRRGYATSHARTGDEAVHAARALQPDLVLMDVGLPGGCDGIAAACRIRQESTVPVVYVTASLDGATRRRMEECPFDGCVPKPFVGEDLETTIAKVLAQRQDGQV